MASSGSTDFTLNRDQIIRLAALDVRAISAGSTMSGAKAQDFNDVLNALVKHWQASGIHVWKLAEATLFPQAGQAKYGMGSGATDHVTKNYVETATSAAAVSGATSISVESTAGISDADNIAVQLDSGALQWTTVSGTPTATTIALAAALTDNAAEGSIVYAYTTKIVRPLKVAEARRYDPVGNRTTPIVVMARKDYYELPNRQDTGGEITQVFYDPGRDIGNLYLWKAPGAVGNLVQFTWWEPIEDFDNASDTPDFPQEWIRALRFNLALDMAGQYPVTPQRLAYLEKMAVQSLDEVSGFDREAESVFFQPNFGPG